MVFMSNVAILILPNPNFRILKVIWTNLDRSHHDIIECYIFSWDLVVYDTSASYIYFLHPTIHNLTIF